MFSISDEKCVHLMGKHCPVHQLKVKQAIPPMTQSLTCMSVPIPFSCGLLPQHTYTTSSLTDVTQVSETLSEAYQGSKQSHSYKMQSYVHFHLHF